MARCEITGKGPTVKNLVSHSNIKTKTRDQPNVQAKRLFSRALNQLVSLNLATSTIRSIEAQGGFDVFILNSVNSKMSKRAWAVKQRIQKKMSGKAGTTKVNKKAKVKQ